jgi:hypothetical protein
MSVEISVLYVVTPYIIVGGYQLFRVPCRLYMQTVPRVVLRSTGGGEEWTVLIRYGYTRQFAVEMQREITKRELHQKYLMSVTFTSSGKIAIGLC